MKLLFDSDMEEIRKLYEMFKFEMTVIEAGKHDKNTSIKNLTEQLKYLYMKLGVYK